MKSIFLIFIAFVCVFIVSCTVQASEVTDDTAKEFVQKVKYIKDEKTGLCFAIVATKQNGNADQNGMSWTWVPCDSVEKFLIKQ